MKQFRTIFARSLPGRSPLCPSRIGIPETKEAIIHHPDHNDFILCQSIARRSRHESGKNASQTCICERSVTCRHTVFRQYWTRVQSTCATRRHTLSYSRVSIVVCQPHGLARGDIPPPPRPQSPRAVEAGALAFLNWTRVQLDLPATCGEAFVYRSSPTADAPKACLHSGKLSRRTPKPKATMPASQASRFLAKS